VADTSRETVSPAALDWLAVWTNVGTVTSTTFHEKEVETGLKPSVTPTVTT
jgi:hypothetical protein